MWLHNVNDFRKDIGDWEETLGLQALATQSITSLTQAVVLRHTSEYVSIVRRC